MTKIFEKYETLFCIFLVVVYIVVNSVCIQNFGNTSCVSAIVNTILSASLIAIMLMLKRTAYYGLKKVENARQYLYFIPLFIIVTVNLWNGFNINYSASEIIFHVLTMLNIGFIEEIIFRGFLFKMMAKNNVKSAVIVSAVTFGAGHIVNLINGADLIPTLIQICYATSIGYLFVVIFIKSKSLIPCIVTHSLVNSLSVFNIENTVSIYIAPVFLIVIPLAYAFYINKKITG
ncbi:MAG: CPBP family intramembrane metalloprotease [Clostridia bacterium]|nr:CPBP family intramembrane metalloprotease [Clostridia bacterium]MBQ6707424.1 CPBP family intramembrane metalloprotease [Clostridia bacterium]